MKNLLEFNEFKSKRLNKLNEIAEWRTSGAGVPGGGVGWSTSLVGRALNGIFSFISKNIDKARMIYYKRLLENEYLSSVMMNLHNKGIDTTKFCHEKKSFEELVKEADAKFDEALKIETEKDLKEANDTYMDALALYQRANDTKEGDKHVIDRIAEIRKKYENTSPDEDNKSDKDCFTTYNILIKEGSKSGYTSTSFPSGDKITVNIPSDCPKNSLISQFTTNPKVTSIKVGDVDQVSNETQNDFTNPVEYTIMMNGVKDPIKNTIEVIVDDNANYIIDEEYANIASGDTSTTNVSGDTVSGDTVSGDTVSSDTASIGTTVDIKPPTTVTNNISKGLKIIFYSLEKEDFSKLTPEDFAIHKRNMQILFNRKEELKALNKTQFYAEQLSWINSILQLYDVKLKQYKGEQTTISKQDLLNKVNNQESKVNVDRLVRENYEFIESEFTKNEDYSVNEGFLGKLLGKKKIKEYYPDLKTSMVDEKKVIELYNKNTTWKKETTDLVNKQVIVDIQISAANMYRSGNKEGGDGLDRRNFVTNKKDKWFLEEFWKKCIAKAKSQYSFYMFVNDVDPIRLYNSEETYRKEKYDPDTDQQRPGLKTGFGEAYNGWSNPDKEFDKKVTDGKLVKIGLVENELKRNGQIGMILVGWQSNKYLIAVKTVELGSSVLAYRLIRCYDYTMIENDISSITDTNFDPKKYCYPVLKTTDKFWKWIRPIGSVKGKKLSTTFIINKQKITVSDNINNLISVDVVTENNNHTCFINRGKHIVDNDNLFEPIENNPANGVAKSFYYIPVVVTGLYLIQNIDKWELGKTDSAADNLIKNFLKDVIKWWTWIKS